MCLNWSYEVLQLEVHRRLKIRAYLYKNLNLLPISVSTLLGLIRVAQTKCSGTKISKTNTETSNIFCYSSQDNYLSARAYEKFVTFVSANLLLEISAFVFKKKS